ncbi:MAG: winged helix-turn-helix transcriptional regulator, partial [Schwartzia sp.]|nr:winged helix-turn-helix transcriptional regulator [Schwartzia sp. (in: firmicutes)]
PGEYASRYKPEDYIKRNVESEIRNPVISKILFLNKSIEKFGSGFKRIDSLCKDAGVEYSYVNSENGFKFVIRRPTLGSDITNVTSNVTSNEVLNRTEATVLAILKVHPNISRDELAEKVSKTVRTIQRTLNSLRDKGYIERKGAKQNTSWEVKK